MIKKLSALSLFIASTAVNATVKYQLDLSQPQHHIGQVTMTIDGGSENTSIKLPAWRTGKYKILDLANGVRHFWAKDNAGNPLDWQHNDKSSWLIENPSQGEITIGYQIYANQLGSRTRHIDDSHAYIDATAVFMYEPKRRNEDILVNLTVPANWNSYSGMKQQGPHQFTAANYDVFADSPIETGVNKVIEFKHDQKNYQLVIWGDGNYDAKQMAKDLEQMVGASQNIWQGYPFDDYIFMVHATTGERGATEHLNSTIIQRKRFTFAPRKEYLEFLNTAAHEFVHTWNVKAYRPKGIAHYDYQRENYSDLLWISEGSTSYFQSQLLLQSGLITQTEFFEGLAKRIAAHLKKPGKREQSIAQSSHESWIALSGDFANNHSVNIYSEGFMASLSLDFSMLEDSKLTAGYSELHRELFNQYRLPKPFTSDDVKALAKSLTGQDYNQWWSANVDTPLQINFEQLLAKAGLEYTYPEETKEIPEPGFVSVEQDGLVTLTLVLKGSKAWDAGLNTNDQIIAINGLRVTQEQLTVRLNQYQAGATINLTIFRRDRLIEKQLVLAKTMDKDPIVQAVKKPSRAQKKFFKAWLGVNFPNNSK